jgi:hypothetical protein
MKLGPEGYFRFWALIAVGSWPQDGRSLGQAVFRTAMGAPCLPLFGPFSAVKSDTLEITRMQAVFFSDVMF